MGHKLPGAISATRAAAFISTAAWIQGTSADDAYLPPDALNNFLRRNGVDVDKDEFEPGATKTRRQNPTQTNNANQGVVSDEPDDSVESSLDDDENPNAPSSNSSLGEPDEESEDEDDEEEDGDPAALEDNNAAAGGGGGGNPGQANQTVDGGGASGLSTGAKAAIAIWTILGVIGIATLVWFLRRRRRRRRMAEGDDSTLVGSRGLEGVGGGFAPMGGDEEKAGFAYAGAPPAGSVGSWGGAAPPPAHLRAASISSTERIEGDGPSGPGGADKGEWMAVPPWQEEPPTWRASQPWRQSKPGSVKNGLPKNPSPRARALEMLGGGGGEGSGGRGQGAPSEAGGYAKTEGTSDATSTIFAWR